jgi:hypothetical protein
VFQLFRMSPTRLSCCIVAAIVVSPRIVRRGQAFILPSLKGLCLLHPQCPALKRWAIFKDFPGIFVLPRHPQRLALRYIQRTFAESPRSIDNSPAL